jgi:hypothetical protein
MPSQLIDIVPDVSRRRRFYPVVFSRTALICLAILGFIASSSRASAQDVTNGPVRWTPSSLQDLVDRLRTMLAIDKAVTASIVPSNPKVASMTPPSAAGQPFQLAIERGFLEGLSEDELSAVIAHELGHVWVSTHHPYLQTEELANSVAMRVVTRDSLERVYAKVWARDGSHEDIVKFLGPRMSAATALAPNK